MPPKAKQNKKPKYIKNKVIKQSQKVNIYLEKATTKRKPVTRRTPGQTIKRGMNLPQPIVVSVPQYTNFQPQMPQPQPMFAQMPSYNKGAQNYYTNAIRQTQAQEDTRENKQMKAEIMPKMVAEPEERMSISFKEVKQENIIRETPSPIQQPEIRRELPTARELMEEMPTLNYPSKNEIINRFKSLGEKVKQKVENSRTPFFQELENEAHLRRTDKEELRKQFNNMTVETLKKKAGQREIVYSQGRGPESKEKMVDNLVNKVLRKKDRN